MNFAVKRISLIAASVFAAASLSGCAWFNVGEEEFACSGMPDSVYCHSARDVYIATNDGAVPSRVGKDGAYNEECEDCERSEGSNFNFEADLIEGGQGNGQTVTTVTASSMTRNGDEVIDNYVSPRLPEHPVPIRTPAVVMRIWIAPWIDENDDLISPGYVYTEIEPRRWIYKDESHRAMTAFAPLQMRGGVPVQEAREGHNSLEKLKESRNAKHLSR